MLSTPPTSPTSISLFQATNSLSLTWLGHPNSGFSSTPHSSMVKLRDCCTEQRTWTKGLGFSWLERPAISRVTENALLFQTCRRSLSWVLALSHPNNFQNHLCTSASMLLVSLSPPDHGPHHRMDISILFTTHSQHSAWYTAIPDKYLRPHACPQVSSHPFFLDLLSPPKTRGYHSNFELTVPTYHLWLLPQLSNRFYVFKCFSSNVCGYCQLPCLKNTL